MSANTDVLTDYNPGSIIRTIGDSQGAIIEEQGAEIATLLFQTIVYGSYTALGITPRGPQPATGTVTFLTSLTQSPPPASQNIIIPSGTIVQTAGGVQFSTTQSGLLASGTTSANVGIIANLAGTAGNVPASAISVLSVNLGYPLFAQNAAPTSGGLAAESPSETAARFAAALAAPGLCSPIAVVDAVIGLQVSGSGETCKFSSAYEPWIAAGSGVGSGTAGFTLYIDNGTGNASQSLINTVNTFINTAPQYRPVGVPYTVSGITPIYASVGVTGQLFTQYEGTNSSVASGISTAISNYFASLPISGSAVQTQIAATAANAAPGLLSSISVQLNQVGGSSNVPSVSASYNQRIILQGVSATIL